MLEITRVESESCTRFEPESAPAVSVPAEAADSVLNLTLVIIGVTFAVLFNHSVSLTFTSCRFSFTLSLDLLFVLAAFAHIGDLPVTSFSLIIRDICPQSQVQLGQGRALYFWVFTIIIAIMSTDG